jgi:hypothetical protein
MAVLARFHLFGCGFLVSCGASGRAMMGDRAVIRKERLGMAQRYREWRRLGPRDAEMARNIYLGLRRAMKKIMGRGYVPDRDDKLTRKYG